jgi:hypothetical protein
MGGRDAVSVPPHLAKGSLMCKLVEKKDHLAVHGLFATRDSAERHLRDTIPEYVRRGFFTNRGLTADSFEIISNKEEPCSQ